MEPEVLEKLREAGRIAAAARALGSRSIVAGASLRDVCVAVEAEIRHRGGQPAFPAQSSRNHLAAHYCASPEDDTRYADGDLVKLDIGVHVDGYVVDTAVTVNVGDRPENRPLKEAAEAALEAAIATAGPGVPVHRVSAAIERTIRGRGLRPMRNLCGHGVGRYVVHCPPPIPNIADEARDVLDLDAVVAIEPFATDGYGLVAEEGVPEVFRLDPGRTIPEGSLIPVEILETIRAFRGLPFARRDLSRFGRGRLEEALATLRTEGLLQSYAPLAEAGGRRVAQAEHTIRITADGAEVLTR